MDPMPVLSEITEDERRTWRYQDEVATRLRKSAYYIIEETKSKGIYPVFFLLPLTFNQLFSPPELPRYSDKYRLTANTHPKLKESDLNRPFFPPQIWDIYFNPKKRRKDDSSS